MNAILDYIEDRSPQGARSVKQRLKAAIDLLADHLAAGAQSASATFAGSLCTPTPT
jgi:plasmid stabilization system protein ParE